jgi:transcription termination/antitermination protein NusG
VLIPTTTDLPWFALYVKPKHEKNVAFILEKKGHEAFLPTYTHRVKNHKKFELPLFPSYVFCRLELSKRLPVMTTPGVFSLVGNGPEPEPIPEQELQAVQRLVRSESMPMPWPYIAPGQEVLVESGPLRGVQGVVVDATHAQWLVVSVNLLRRSVAVRVDRENLSLKLVPASSRNSKSGTVSSEQFS